MMDCQGPVGVVGYNNVVYGFDILKKLLPMEIVKVELRQAEDVESAIAAYRDTGITTFIGDTNVREVSERLGSSYIQITSQKESILTAIQEARRILQSAKAERLRAQQIITVTDFVHDGIIAINAEGVISIFNRAAEKIFHVDKEEALNAKVTDVVPQCALPETLRTRRPMVGHVLRVGGNSIAINRAPVVVDGAVTGAVATFQDVTEMQKVEQKVRRTLADRGFSARYTFEDIVHESAAMRDCIETARQYAEYDTPVLVTGESGVGKELFCQSIHNGGSRRDGPFVAINCAAIPPSLMETELFGYAEGSFTGASRKGRAGIFELAHRGTVFLDEIGEIPLELQGRLLRVVQERQVLRLGDDKMIPVDVRIICATNRPLERMVREERFRRDLFFRINILTLHVPSLRRRGAESILALAAHFMRTYSERYGKPPLPFTAEVRAALTQRRYEGNVRELEGLMERCVILGTFAGLCPPACPSGCPPDCAEHDAAETWTAAKDASAGPPEPGRSPDLRTVADRYIRQVYERAGGNVREACAVLGINRSTLWRRLRALQAQNATTG
jgi:PAS domain S-box-containing protein